MTTTIPLSDGEQLRLAALAQESELHMRGSWNDLLDCYARLIGAVTQDRDHWRRRCADQLDALTAAAALASDVADHEDANVNTETLALARSVDATIRELRKS